MNRDGKALEIGGTFRCDPLETRLGCGLAAFVEDGEMKCRLGQLRAD